MATHRKPGCRHTNVLRCRATLGLVSQPTLSRCTAMLAGADNLKVLREAALELADRNLRAENEGARRDRVTLDVDSLPIEVHGH